MPTTTWTTAAVVNNHTVNPSYKRTFAATMSGTTYPATAPHKVTAATITYSAVTMWSSGRNFWSIGVGAKIGDRIGTFVNDGNSNQHSVTYNCNTGTYAAGGGYNGITALGAEGNNAGTGTALSIRNGCVITLTVTWEYTTSIWVNVNGTWRRGFPWANVGGTWRQGTAWANVGGTWRRGI